jgi:hypothetical protein
MHILISKKYYSSQTIMEFSYKDTFGQMKFFSCNSSTWTLHSFNHFEPMSNPIKGDTSWNNFNLFVYLYFYEYCVSKSCRKLSLISKL